MALASTLIVAGIAWLAVRRWLGSTTIATATALAIASHTVLDLLTHTQDIALVSFVDLKKLGLGLYAVPSAAFVAETLYGILCWWIYRGSLSLLAMIVAFNLANFTFFSTAIVGPEALLANQPLVLATIVFVQIVVTLSLVGLLSRRDAHWTLISGTRTTHA